MKQVSLDGLEDFSGPARRPRCSSRSEKKSRRPFGKIKFFIRTAGGGTFQGTCDTATDAGAPRIVQVQSRCGYRRRATNQGAVMTRRITPRM